MKELETILKIEEILNEYSVECCGEKLGLEDQLTMVETWESETPWYEIKKAEILGKIAECNARIKAVVA